MELKAMCGLCTSFFSCPPVVKEGRICEKRPLDKKGRVVFIQMETEACGDFEKAKSLYCPYHNYYMSFGTCLKTAREYKECPHCEMGWRATLIFRGQLNG